jgi:uncharacterized Tic20 family protein
MEDIQQRKLLSALSHGAIFFSSTIISVGIPIAILLISNDPIIKQNAKESLNFHINLYIYAVISVLLIVVGIGILLLIVLGVVSFIMPIIAIMNVINQPNVSYSYPFIFRFV